MTSRGGLSTAARTSTTRRAEASVRPMSCSYSQTYVATLSATETTNGYSLSQSSRSTS